MAFKEFADQVIKDQIQFRRSLHRIAEPSGEEQKTAKFVQDFLEETEPDRIVDQIGGYGLVAVYEGTEEGPTVMIRCELDALPISEENDFDHRSEHEGTGHKCGHDGHMSIVAGVGSYLKQHRPTRGTVMLLFQPAEETGRGAVRVLEDEKFSDLQPDYIFALHNLPGYNKHDILVRDHVFASASKGILITLKGSTAHAAHPDEGRSPALATAQIVETLSAIPQFYTSLFDSAKVTVIYTRLGEKAFGTSPGYAEVAATLRSRLDEDMATLEEKTVELSRRIALTYDLEMDYEWTEPFKATVNDETCTELIREAAKANDYPLIDPDTPFAWSEDFGQFLDQYKGALFGIGAGKDHPQLHAPTYDFPDEIIHTGLTMFLDIIDRLVDLPDHTAQ